MATSPNNQAIKHSGQVFTPAFLVKLILDYASYVPNHILQKHIIDNSCGDGAFLCEIVARYCQEYKRIHGHIEGLEKELSQYIHGIELDDSAYENCLYNLEQTALAFGLSRVQWDISHANALSVIRFDGKMDFVVGNPPYVRVHNLAEDYDIVKTFRFAKEGMTDLYLVFFELGFRMLNETGRLCYITPNSWLSSTAAAKMRNYIMTYRNLVGIIDLGHYQAFDNATTYTAIALFDVRHATDTVDYFKYSPESRNKILVDTLSYQEMAIGGSFYVASKEDLALLRAIKTSPRTKYANVKNGFATLADKVFILDIPFKDLTIPVLKASTGKWHRGFFPYDAQGKPLSKDEIFSHQEIAIYLNRNKQTLLKKRTEKQKPDWYLYGRTQALKDVFEKKYSINTIIRDISTVKLIEVPVGSGLYSGLYILTSVSYEILADVIKSEEFIAYVKMLKNYKSGGYYTFNSKDLEQYLNYKLSQHVQAKNFVPIDKCRISGGNLELF